MVESKAPDRFLEVHKLSAVPLYVTNGVFPLLDKFLQPLISFFVSAFDDTSSPSYPTVLAFVWSFSSAIQVPLVEALCTSPDSESYRSMPWINRISTRLLKFPMIWAILYQRLAGGFILPIWLFCFLQALNRASNAPIRRAQAESALVGWWLGHTIPALVLLIPGQPALSAVPIWVAFPILMSVFQGLWLWLRTRVFKGLFPGKSGYVPLQITYASALVFSFMAHTFHVTIPALRDAPSLSPTPIILVNKLIGLFHALFIFFLAPFNGPLLGLAPPTTATTTAASGVAHFVQCDVLIVFSAVWVALLWDLALRRRTAAIFAPNTAMWLAGMAAALLLGGLILSPGAATGALLMYREAQLERSRDADHDMNDEDSAREPLLGAVHRRVAREKSQPRAVTY